MKKANLFTLSVITLLFFSSGDLFGQCDDVELILPQDGNNIVCSGSDVVLGIVDCVNDADYEYLWTSSALSGVEVSSSNMPTFTVTQGTSNPGSSNIVVTFGVRVVTIAGTDTTEISTDDLDVTILPEASVTIEVAAGSPALCQGNNIELEANYDGGSDTPDDVIWAGAVAQPNPLFAVDNDVEIGAQYGVTVTDTEGCEASISDVTFTINPIPTGFSIGGDTDYCVGDQMTLNLVGLSGSDFDCEWKRGPTDLTANANCGYTGPAIAGTYQLVITSDEGCESDPVTQGVTVNDLVLTINPEVDEVCQNGPLVDLGLTSSQNTVGNETVTSVPDNDVIVGSQFNFVPTLSTPPGDYVITYAATFEACEKSVTTTISINEVPIPSVSSPAGYCAGEEMVLVGDPNGVNFTCQWFKDDVAIPDDCELVRNPVQVSDAGTYSMQITNTETNCVLANPINVITVSVDSLTVLVEPLVEPNGVCPNEGPFDLNLTPPLNTDPPNESFSSSPNIGSALNGESFQTQFLPAITEPDTITFTYVVTKGFCMKEASADVIVLPLPEVNVSSIAPVCNINSVLDLSDFVSPTGGIFTLADGSDFNGIFSPVDTTDNITLNFDYEYTEPTTGCTVIVENNTVQINPELVIDFEDDLALCFGTEENLGAQASGGGEIYNYAWSNVNLLETPSNEPSPTLLTTIESGDYTFSLTVTDQNGCSRTGTQDLMVRDQPEVTISSSPVIFCEGDELVLTANFTGGIGEPDYFWQNDNTTPDQPDTFDTGEIDEEESFSVLIIFPSETGCALASTNRVFVPSPSPNPSILSATTSEDAPICDNQVSIYFAENRVPGTELVWSLEGLNQNVDSVASDDDLFYVYWGDNLTGTETVFLNEFLSQDCQALVEKEVSFSGSTAPPPAELFLSSLNGILVYNQSGLCYRWGFIDPNANVNANPPESYLNFDLDENNFQSLVIGDLDTTLTYFCQTWLPGDCEDVGGSCSTTIVYQPKNNSFPEPPSEEKLEFNVFPNPNTGDFRFEIGDLIADRNYNWELRNSLGQIIDAGDFVPSGRDHTESLSVRNQAQGIYLLTISDGREILKVSRVSIQN